MTSLRLLNIAQPTFPNQKIDERVFVFSRRHPIDFLFFAFIITILFLTPIVLLVVLFFTGNLSSLFSTVQTGNITILAFFFYYLFWSVLTLGSWIIYYYNIFIVTDERIVEVAQSGLFSREIYELTFEQIEDVSTISRGFLNTIFDVGDIEIQTAGTERNFLVRRIPRAQAAVEIINELAHQAKIGKGIHERFPELPNIGLLNGKLIPEEGDKPKIMNLEKNLKNNHVAYACGTFQPKNLREYFDYWWWRHCNQMIVTFGTKSRNQEQVESKTEPSSDKSDNNQDDIDIHEIEEVDDNKNN